jgi:hypothetical protein
MAESRTSPCAPPEALERALIEEAAKKSGLLWARGADGGPAVPLWHVWHDGAICLVGGGPDEQPLPGLTDGSTAYVTLRSKDKGGRLITFPAAVRELAPRGDAWHAAVADLRPKRLNAPDAPTLPDRWARDCHVLLLTPCGPPTETPQAPPTASHAAAPRTGRRPGSARRRAR